MLKLSWRNIWRNKRRSIISIFSIFFAIFFAIGMRSLQLGMYDKMVDSIVRYYTGYIQIHSKGYWEEPTPDNLMETDTLLIAQLKEDKEIQGFAKRMEGFSLCSFRNFTKGIMITGLEVKNEKKLIDLESKMIQGNLFTSNKGQIIIGKGLASYMKIQLSDTLILLGQGRHGASAAGKFSVCGIAGFSSPQLNDAMVFLPLESAQEYFSTENGVSSYSLSLSSPKQTEGVMKRFKSSLDTTKYEIMTWNEMLPELKQTIQADSAGGIIMLLILYMVITFGMFGTLLMMTNERIYEFSILLSIGMNRLKIGSMIMLETLILSFIGAFAGLVGILPVAVYFNIHPFSIPGNAARALKNFGFEPVFPASLDPSIWFTHGSMIFLIAVLISIYPLVVILRLKPVEGMRK